MVSILKADKMTWAGRVMTALAGLPFLFSASMKLSPTPAVIQGSAHLGWPESSLMLLCVLEFSCTLLYLIPQTAVLGAIVLTGYLGGAIATHVRLGEPVVLHIIIGILIWGGLFLRDRRLRALLPLRSTHSS